MAGVSLSRSGGDGGTSRRNSISSPWVRKKKKPPMTAIITKSASTGRLAGRRTERAGRCPSLPFPRGFSPIPRTASKGRRTAPSSRIRVTAPAAFMMCGRTALLLPDRVVLETVTLEARFPRRCCRSFLVRRSIRRELSGPGVDFDSITDTGRPCRRGKGTIVTAGWANCPADFVYAVTTLIRQPDAPISALPVQERPRASLPKRPASTSCVSLAFARAMSGSPPGRCSPSSTPIGLRQENPFTGDIVRRAPEREGAEHRAVW